MPRSIYLDEAKVPNPEGNGRYIVRQGFNPKSQSGNLKVLKGRYKFMPSFQDSDSVTVSNSGDFIPGLVIPSLRDFILKKTTLKHKY